MRAGGCVFSAFRHDYHHHRLPRVQTRARGGVFRLFRPPATITTPLTSKCEPGVVFFGFLTQLPPSPPPSHANASRRRCLPSFSTTCHHYHPPRVQMRAGGCVFRPSITIPTTTVATSLAFKREPEVVFDVHFACLPPPPPPSHPNASRR